MTAVLLTPPYLQFFDSDGVTPLAGGKVYTYTSTGGTFATPKATYTTAAGSTSAPNPIILNDRGIPETGDGGIWLIGSYDFKVTDVDDVQVGQQLAVSAFTALPASSTAYFQSFSGTGAQTAFTTSTDLGTDEKAIFVWVDAGAGKGYEIQNPSAYTINGTTLTFSVAPASGTNNIYVSAPSTLVGAASSAAAAAAASEAAAAASEAAAAASETAAAASETAAAASETAAATAQTNAETAEANAEAAEANVEAAVSSVTTNWLFDSSTTMADPGTGDIRLNHATVASATSVAVSALTAETGNPDISNYIATWDDGGENTNRGTLIIRKAGAPATFAIFTITGTVTDNTTWLQFTVAYVTGNGSFSNTDSLYVQFLRSGANGGGLAEVVDDPSPQLGGNLDVNGHGIVFPTTTITDCVTGDSLSVVSSTTLVSSEAIKTYVNNRFGMVLLSTQTASSSTALNFNNTLVTSAYKAYAIILSDIVPATDGAGLYLGGSTNNGSSLSSGGYHTSNCTESAGTYAASATNANGTGIEIANNVGSAAGENYSGIFFIHNPSSSTSFKNVNGLSTYINSSAVRVGGHVVGGWSSATAINYLRIIFSAGNITSGTAKLYGIL